MAKTINVAGFYSRDDQWLVIVGTRTGRMTWNSFHDTQDAAEEHLREAIATEQYEFGFITQTPFVVAEE